MPVSKRTRYEVLKRDNHTCRYCGGTAPDVKLTVDHVTPVALGGSDAPDNLVAACRDCNAGKSSTSPDAPLVADVAQDALRWVRAMETAARMAQEERDVQQANIEAFRRGWDRWSYEYQGKRCTVDLPGGWETKVRELFNAGLTQPDATEAINLAMGNKYVKDEFAYFIGICRQKIAQHQSVAQELIRRGLVD